MHVLTCTYRLLIFGCFFFHTLHVNIHEASEEAGYLMIRVIKIFIHNIFSKGIVEGRYVFFFGRGNKSAYLPNIHAINCLLTSRHCWNSLPPLIKQKRTCIQIIHNAETKHHQWSITLQSFQHQNQFCSNFDILYYKWV